MEIDDGRKKLALWPESEPIPAGTDAINDLFDEAIPQRTQLRDRHRCTCWHGPFAFFLDARSVRSPIPGVHRALYDGMPDLRFNPTNFTDDGHTVRFNVALTMHHTGTLALPALGVADLAPTNKSIALPPETATVVVRDGKLASWSNVTPVDGGLGRILAEAGGS